jgi:gamma-aminobutyric acid receptor subunit beta
MYWRDEPVVGVEDAELPQFTIVGWETNERKIKLATGQCDQTGQTFLNICKIFAQNLT